MRLFLRCHLHIVTGHFLGRNVMRYRQNISSKFARVGDCIKRKRQRNKEPEERRNHSHTA